MQPTTEILERISKDSLTHKEEVFTRLYRYLLRPDIYYQAYQRLYTNKGASTKGINQDTADGFSEAKIEKIIQSLADETYQPTPVRRTYIAKKSNPKKKRPLGIPTFTDKLVQEALRMILEAIYEPLFLDCSHGFRPKRSCHTALDKLKYQFGGVRWFVEGDIKGCLRGICNYYGIASNFCKLKYLSYLMEYSCLKTLAAKHKSKISKVVAMYKDGTGEWGIPYETKKKAKRRYFANYMDCKDAKISTDCISNAAIIYGQSVTPLEKRLKARICELCGTTESERYEIHHINKLKNLKGKEPWEIAMLAKRRKTLVVCEHCHHLIHNQ